MGVEAKPVNGYKLCNKSKTKQEYDRRKDNRCNSEESLTENWESEIEIHQESFQRKYFKRFLDIVLSGTGIIAISPILLFIALVIKLKGNGRVLYSGERVGQGGKLFACYKFRTMVENAEALKEKLEKYNEQGGVAFKMKNDPRIDGYFSVILRKFSLDELPQLFNVLKGDMSLVGPRPPLAKEVEKYKKWYLRRLSVKPGITCIWQVSGRNNISFEDWMRLDLRYIDNWSIVEDIKLLYKTIGAVITAKGAS